jgi:hypothetical protein
MTVAPDRRVEPAALHELQLDFELHADILQRALGRGGAPVDVQVARRAIPFLQAALFKLLAALPKKEG